MTLLQRNKDILMNRHTRELRAIEKGLRLLQAYRSEEKI